jgi:hypothetical protein
VNDLRERLIKPIPGLFLASIAATLVVLINKLSSGWPTLPADSIVVYLLLLILSVVSFIHYISVVFFVDNTGAEEAFSFVVVFTFLILSLVGIYWETYWVLGVGTALIAGKTVQVHYSIRRLFRDPGDVKSYSLQSVLFYILFSCVVTVLSLLVDFEVVTRGEPDLATFQDLRESVSLSIQNEVEYTQIAHMIGTAESQYEAISDVNRTLLLILLLLIVPVVLYFFHRLILFYRGIDLSDVKRQISNLGHRRAS